MRVVELDNDMFCVEKTYTIFGKIFGTGKVYDIDSFNTLKKALNVLALSTYTLEELAPCSLTQGIFHTDKRVCEAFVKNVAEYTKSPKIRRVL